MEFRGKEGNQSEETGGGVIPGGKISIPKARISRPAARIR